MEQKNENERPASIDKKWDSFWAIADENGNQFLFFNETGVYDGNGNKLTGMKQQRPDDEHSKEN